MLKIKTLNVSTFNESLNIVDKIIQIFKTDGILVLKGYKFSEKEQLILGSKIGDLLDWNINTKIIETESYENLLKNFIFYGGHSDNPNKEKGEEQSYAVDWHIEQVFYVHPFLAGIWNMFKFDAEKTSGKTLFVDSSTLYTKLLESEKNFLKNSIIEWDKPIGPHAGFGPYYTRAIDTHKITNLETIRIETDNGCIIKPRLYKYKGTNPTAEEKDFFEKIYLKIKDTLFSDTSIRYTHEWEEGDVLFVDLFKMYHAVTDGFEYNTRKFSGIFARPNNYTAELFTDPDIM